MLESYIKNTLNNNKKKANVDYINNSNIKLDFN